VECVDDPWEARLFAFLDDLEQQAGATFAAERDQEVAERARAEYARVGVAARLMASLDREVALDVEGAGPVAGRLRRVADGWLLVAAASGSWIVRLEAIALVRGAAPGAVPPEAWPVTARLGLGSALRGLAGEPCVVHARGGQRYEARLGRVGADFVEAQIGADPVPSLVAFSAIAAVQQRR
jgi:hypothetical protein